MWLVVFATTFLVQGSDISDDFSSRREELWLAKSDTWLWQDGFVRQTAVGRRFIALVANATSVEDFSGRVRVRIRGGQTYRSAGILFDYVDSDNWRGVYLTNVGTGIEPFGPKIQIFSCTAGKTTYPREAKIKFPVVLQRWYVLEVSVSASTIEVSLDGTLKLSYPVQGARKRGKVALFTFDAEADFDEFRLNTLSP
jgi:hypothetical protein